MKRACHLLLLLALLCLFAGTFACGDDDDDDDNDDDNDTPADDDATDDDDDDNNDDDNDDNDDDDDDTTPPDEVNVYLDGGELVLENSYVVLRYHLADGRYRVLDAAGTQLVTGAEAIAYSNVLMPKYVWRGSEMPGYEWTQQDTTNALGSGKSIIITRGGKADAPAFVQTFTLLAGCTGLLADVRLENATGARIKVGAIYPLIAEPPHGGVHLGAPRDIRVMANGFLNYIDYATPIFPGTLPMISNWSVAMHNLTTGKTMVLGFLKFALAQGVFYTQPAGGALKVHADCQYDPAIKVRDGEAITSEMMILDFAQPTAQATLEPFADRIKAWNDIELWTERHPEIGIPAGWNSWAGGGSSGGYGTDINEAVIVENMDFADRELRRWGMNFFQLDDGWQTKTGDWEVNEARFPNHGDQNGLEWLMERAHNLGFYTGLWISAFVAVPDANVVAEHPDWIADEWLFGLLGQYEKLLDLTHPEVQEYLAGITQNMVDWGIDWLKLDFGYLAMLSTNWHDPDNTRISFYREGVRAMREVAGDDVFFLNVGLIGANYDQVDAVRTTLDTMPVWEGEYDDPYSFMAIIENQGLKPMYRDSTRRYFLHNRVWVNHPDLIFFRAHAQPQFPALTMNESRTFVTGVALQGGIVKIGDRIVDIPAEGVDVLRRIMPAYAPGGRPLDLFTREFPEVWHVAVPDFDEPYHVIGLLNWGLNRDLTQASFPFMDDDARLIEADLAAEGLDDAYHAFEFWTQEYLGEVSDTLELEVPARNPRVVHLRPILDRPQLVGTNRHVIGGVQVIDSLAWDGDALTLTGEQEGSIGTDFSPFEHRLTFFAPAGYTALEAEVSVTAGYQVEGLSFDVDGNVATLRFTVAQLKQKLGDWHPDVTWVVEFE